MAGTIVNFHPLNQFIKINRRYGIGLKQLLAVLARLRADQWTFDMVGSVEHKESRERGWNRIWSDEFDEDLSVCGNITFGSLEQSVTVSCALFFNFFKK